MIKMNKNWYEYTLEDDEALYTEDFNLMEALGEKPKEVHPSEPAEEVNGLSEPAVKLVRGFTTVEQLEQESFQQLDTTEKSCGIDRLKQQVVNERRLRRKSEDEMGMTLVLLKMDMAAKASQAKTTEANLREEVEQLKTALEHKDDTIHAQQVAHEMSVQELKKELKDVKLKTKQIISAHMIQLNQQAKATQEVKAELGQVRADNTSLLTESVELKAQIQSRDIEVESLTSLVAELKDMTETMKENSLQQQQEWHLERQFICRQIEEAKSKLLKTETKSTLLLEKNNQLEVYLGNLHKELEELSKSYGELDGRLQEEAQANLLMRQELQKKDVEMDVMSDMNKSRDQNVKLKLQVQEVQGQLRSKEEANQFLNESLNKLKKELELEKQEKAAALRNCEDLKEGQRTVKQERSQISALSRKLKETEEERSLLEEALLDMELKLEKRQEWCRKLLSSKYP